MHLACQPNTSQTTSVLCAVSPSLSMSVRKGSLRTHIDYLATMCILPVTFTDTFSCLLMVTAEREVQVRDGEFCWYKRYVVGWHGTTLCTQINSLKRNCQGLPDLYARLLMSLLLPQGSVVCCKWYTVPFHDFCFVCLFWIKFDTFLDVFFIGNQLSI